MPNITFIDKYITDGKKSQMSLSKFYDSMLCTNIPLGSDGTITDLYRVPLYDIFLRYRPQLADAIVTYYIESKMFYKPKMVSMSIYGTTEMWIAILRLNKMRNISEFNKHKILIYEPDQVNELLQIFLKREGKT